MFLGAKGGLTQTIVGFYRSGNDNGVDVGVFDNITFVLREFDVRVLYGNLSASLRLKIATGDDFAVAGSIEISNEIRSPVSQTDDTYFNFQARPL
jgi:hypothetical protein